MALLTAAQRAQPLANGWANAVRVTASQSVDDFRPS